MAVIFRRNRKKRTCRIKKNAAAPLSSKKSLSFLRLAVRAGRTAFSLSSIRIPVVYLFDRRSDPSVSFIVSRIDSGYSRHRGHDSHQNRNQCHKTDRSNSNNNTKFHVYLLRRPAACLNSLHIFPYTEQKNNLLHSKRAYTVINKMYMKKKAVTGGGKPDFPCRDLPPIPPGKCFSPKNVSAITESRFRVPPEKYFRNDYSSDYRIPLPVPPGKYFHSNYSNDYRLQRSFH